MTYLLDLDYLGHEYQSGRSIAAISRELGVDSSVIRKRLVAVGVGIRGPRAATIANLCRDPSIVQRMGRPRTYPVNEDYFETFTPNMAYIVGLLQADGSNQVGRGVVRITLKLSDQAILHNIANEMGASRPLIMDVYGNPGLFIQNRALSDGLARWGVISPKTHTASTHPMLRGNRHYWRGVIDGDGTLCTTAGRRHILALVGSKAVCSEFLAFCQARGTGRRVNVIAHKSIYSVHLSGKDARIIANVLYKGNSLTLRRKYATAQAWQRAHRGEYLAVGTMT